MEISNFYSSSDGSEIIPMMMIGVVTNNNDPQQMGRVQVYISALSEHQQHVIEDQLPWASYVSPIGGIDERSARGPAKPGQNVNSPYGDKSAGAVSYGMWAIPKVGSRVIVVAIDNDPNQLYYIGCVFDNSTTHTMPHGRYITDAPGADQGPDGPLTSTEQPIEPLYTNTLKAFGDHENYEWRTRGADYSVAAISPIRLASDIDSDTNENHTGTVSKRLDDRDTEIVEDDGQIVGKDIKFRQGYALSRSDPSKVTNDEYHDERNKRTDRNLEPTVTSITTPGFHAIAMDDRPENCRMRFRTATGHQMIMDDTNERIYVSTSEGRNWIEMDSDGNIYIFSEESVSLRAKGDINLTADKTVRIKGNQGVHIQSDNEVRVESTDDMHIMSKKSLYTTITEDIHTHSQGSMYETINVDRHMNILTGSQHNTISKGNVELKVTEGYVHNYIEGKSSTHVGGSVEFEVGGSISTESSGYFSLKSSNVEIDPSGHLEIAGDFTAADIECTTALATGNMQAADFGTSTFSLLLHLHTGNLGTPTSPPDKGGTVSASNATAPTPDDPNVGPPDPATKSTGAQYAYFPTILPNHEPWGRTFMDVVSITEDRDPEDGEQVSLSSTPHNHNTPLYSYDSVNIGRNMKLVIDTNRERNPLWHR